MDIISSIIGMFSNQDPLFRIILIVLIALYGFFALILTIQIKNLNKIINQISFSPIFIIFAFLHLFATLALLIFAVLFL